MSQHLVSLEKWAQLKFGPGSPHIGTLRRWARDGKISPAPRKHGRAYFVAQDAEYVDDYSNLTAKAFTSHDAA